MEKETKEHYFARLDEIEKVRLKIADLKKQIESLETFQYALVEGPDNSQLELASSEKLIEWGEEWRQKQKTKN